MLAMAPCTTSALETKKWVSTGANILTEVADIPSEVFLLKQLQAKNTKQIRKAAYINITTKALIIAEKLSHIILFRNENETEDCIFHILATIPQILDIIVDGTIIRHAKTISHNNTINKNNAIPKSLLTILTVNKALLAAECFCALGISEKDGQELKDTTKNIKDDTKNTTVTFETLKDELWGTPAKKKNTIKAATCLGIRGTHLATWLAYFITKAKYVRKLCKKQP